MLTQAALLHVHMHSTNPYQVFLTTVKTQIDNFTEKLEKLKTLSTFQFTDGEKVADRLSAYKLELQFFSELDSEKLTTAIAPINESLGC